MITRGGFRATGGSTALIFAALAVASLLPTPALAQETGQDLVGTWKREDGKLFRLDWDAQASELTGTMLEPPENSVTHIKYAVELHLHREGNKVTGKAVWIDANPKKGQPGQPDFWSADSRWEYELVGTSKLKGRSEYLSFGRGKVFEKDWDAHELERLPMVTLGARGKAPEKVEAAQPIDDQALMGSWKTNTGAFVRFKPEEKGYVLERATGSGDFPAKIRVVNDGNVLRGVAEWSEGVETKVELHLAAAGRLEGRAESVEGGKDAAQRGWQPLALEKLARIDAGAMNWLDEPPLGAGAPGELAAMDWKRDDGLYLLLSPASGGFTGELVSKTKETRAKVDLTPGPDNKLIGKATFDMGGTPVEAKWELAPQPDGTLEARCEWVDWDPATKTAVARGSATRKFKPLKRVG